MNYHSTSLRIGQGYDFHAFAPEGTLIIGGVTIPHPQGIKAHSDGDVLLHALCDAIIGAIGLGDIGQHFPDTDPQYKNANSRHLLAAVVQLMQQQHFGLINLDATIILEKPKLAPYLSTMKENIAADLQVTPTQINLKAKTMEGLGIIGQGLGLAAHVVVLLQLQRS